MFMVFIEHRLLCIAYLILLLLSIICQMAIGVILKKMLRETDNMSATANKRLKQCKLKFMNCYQLNGSVANVPVFVDKFLSKLTFMGISLRNVQHLAGQLVLLSVAVAGIGVCREIIEGNTVGNVLPYYLASFLGLYVYFSVSGMVDIEGKMERLKISLVDYLENHMVNKLRQSAIDWEGLTGEQISMLRERMERERGAKRRENQRRRQQESGEIQEAEEAGHWQKDREEESTEEEGNTGREKAVPVFSRQDEQELEELLREFFT